MSRFCWPTRVYWEDTDGGGVVYYANYLKFLERARSEWLRDRGFSQQLLARDPGIIFTVMSVRIDYRRPARLDDQLLVTCQPRREGAASLSFMQGVYRQGASAVASASLDPSTLPEEDLIAAADVRIACVNARTFRPQRMPESLIGVLAQESA